VLLGTGRKLRPVQSFGLGARKAEHEVLREPVGVAFNLFVEAFGGCCSVFYDLFPKAEADELVMRSTLLRGLKQWLKESGLTQTQAAKMLGITQARVSGIKRGKFNQFSLDMLVRLASRAGLKPRLKLAA
jgi:predicted XRE-type DNA-binding protein